MFACLGVSVVFWVFVGLSLVVAVLVLLLATDRLGWAWLRPVVVVVLLACVGANLVFLVYARGKVESGLSTERVVSEARARLAKEFPDRVYVPRKVDLKVREVFSKASALDSFTALLNRLVSVSETDSKGLVSGGKSFKDVVPGEVLARFHLTDVMRNDGVYTNLSVALLSAVNGLKKDGRVEVKVASLDNVFLDEKSRSAFVPLDVFKGGFTGLTVQLVFVDGVWMVSPYVLLHDIEVSDRFNQLAGSLKRGSSSGE